MDAHEPDDEGYCSVCAQPPDALPLGCPGPLTSVEAVKSAYLAQGQAVPAVIRISVTVEVPDS